MCVVGLSGLWKCDGGVRDVKMFHVREMVNGCVCVVDVKVLWAADEWDAMDVKLVVRI